MAGLGLGVVRTILRAPETVLRVRVGIDAATLQRLSDAWHEYAVPCETELKGGKVPHACKCMRDGHERWCVVGVDGFSTWLSQTNGPLSKAIQATKAATHMISLLKQAVPGLETAHCDKAARAPAGTRYVQERPRNAIVRWRAKSEGKLNPPKPSKAPVARVEKPITKRKTTTFGAEQGKRKKQKPIVVMGVSGAGAHGVPQTQDDIDQARAARKEREQKKQKAKPKKQRCKKVLNVNSYTSKSDASDEDEVSERSEVSDTSEEAESDDDGSRDETSDEDEDEEENEDEDEEDNEGEEEEDEEGEEEDEGEEDSQNESSDED